MGTPFPYLDRQVTLGCTYLQKDEEYEEMSRQLENAVTVSAMFENRNGVGDFTEVQQFLVNTFGGTVSDYSYFRRGLNHYLLALPLEMNRNNVVNWGTA